MLQDVHQKKYTALSVHGQQQAKFVDCALRLPLHGIADGQMQRRTRRS